MFYVITNQLSMNFFINDCNAAVLLKFIQMCELYNEGYKRLIITVIQKILLICLYCDLKVVKTPLLRIPYPLSLFIEFQNTLKNTEKEARDICVIVVLCCSKLTKYRKQRLSQIIILFFQEEFPTRGENTDVKN